MITTRFAPSPTGRLHLGHAFSAAVGHREAAVRGGRFLLRIEDLDPTRSRPEFVDDIFADLRWLGLEWGQPLLVQSARAAAYQEALDILKREGLVYACFCTRADIAQSLIAPHGDGSAAYPGTCRDLPDDEQRRATAPHAWRLNARKALNLAGLPSWSERDGSRFTAKAEQIDDAILARKDAPAAYHLACVVDDAASEVTTVVRGADLRASTPIQRLLQIVLDLPEPTYLHHPLVTHADGRRLAKRDLAPTLAALRESGVDGSVLADQLIVGDLPAGFRLQDA